MDGLKTDERDMFSKESGLKLKWTKGTVTTIMAWKGLDDIKAWWEASGLDWKSADDGTEVDNPTGEELDDLDDEEAENDVDSDAADRE
ncbi:hypothetical protein HDV00_011380 [Rhizophlyctis rosea]|nr:hypothetical protein HDV00_011380 [Rhizophlyctis rosea]